LAVSPGGQVKSMKTYEKPALLKVDLVADQAVLGCCKKNGITAGSGVEHECENCCAQCSVPGS
jgi:hypothetical protein